MSQPAQIPFSFFPAAPPRFESFVVGSNGEAITRLYALTDAASTLPRPPVVALWGPPGVGKSHLLAAVAAQAAAGAALWLGAGAGADWPAEPFVDARIVCVDDADRLSESQQGWLFTAFNHVVGRGGCIVASGHSPTATWPLRDDLRTRLGSGLSFEIRSPDQDALPDALREHARQRGIELHEEVLAYILSRSRRDIATLWRLVNGLDELSLARKRPITLALLREYLARRNLHQDGAEDAKNHAQ